MIRKTYSGISAAAVMESIKNEIGEDVNIVDIKHVNRNQIDITIEFDPQGSKRVIPIDHSNSLLVEKEVHGNEQNPKSHECSYESKLRYILLERLGVAQDVADLIFQCWPETHGSLTERMEFVLARCLRVLEQVEFNNRFIAVMGSGDSGKSSVILKLAHQLQNNCNINCGILHLDYSPVAIDNSFIKELGVPIVSCPLKECYPAILGQVLGEFSGCDLIFLDIPSDALSGEEESSSWCARLFSLLKSVEVLVTLDARLQPTVLRRLLQSARTYGDASAVITRMDEGAPLGSVISILSALSVPISFLSTGKVVPVDIEPASVSRLAWWLSKSFLEGGVDVRRINQVVENRLNDGLVVGRESVASNTSLNVTPVLFSEFM